MKKTITTLALIALCGFAAGSAIAGDQENIQGTWTLETATLDGNAMPKVAVTYVFTGATLVVHPEGGKEQKGIFALEISSKPRVMVVQHDQHVPDAQPDRTPYELDGDTLKIVLSAPDEHVTEISDKGHMLFTLKRKK